MHGRLTHSFPTRTWWTSFHCSVEKQPMCCNARGRRRQSRSLTGGVPRGSEVPCSGLKVPAVSRKRRKSSHANTGKAWPLPANPAWEKLTCHRVPSSTRKGRTEMEMEMEMPQMLERGEEEGGLSSESPPAHPDHSTQNPFTKAKHISLHNGN